ncbi:MAG: CpaD family pilus assembly protein [Asticcacaulis sp.]|uniref:CpaD family pilus assembly protein n=1 Tax=Asticcacaulis sp. TaxID=1872648 RepID=UPI0039E70B58
MISKSFAIKSLAIAGLCVTTGLGGCATDSGKTDGVAFNVPTPTEQYPLQAQTLTKTVNLRINPNGLSTNQRTALDQMAAGASWKGGEPVDIEIITSPDPAAIAAGQEVGDYLVAHDVSATSLSQGSEPSQPGDIVTLNIVTYRARTYACGQAWENLAATRNNAPYQNYGCAVSSNLAAQIADPRDLQTPRTATSIDMGRRSAVLEKYRKGEVTSSAKDDEANGKISDAIK